MTATLRNGGHIPLVGLGTFKIRGKEEVQRTLNAALKAGYRLIDTASVYRNETEIGECLQDLLPRYSLQRSDIFITSKLGPKDQGEGSCYSAFLKSLSNLQCQYLDLYLIHWPGTQGKKPDDPQQHALRVGSWQDLIKLQKEGKVKHIGVSNFLQHHIQELFDETGVYPGVLQILTDPVVTDVSKKLQKSVSQVLLRWAVQEGIGVLPKSCNPDHIRENIDIFSFQIPEEYVCSLNSLDKGKHYCWNPVDIL
uniref:Uncharacterized protein LOC111111846 isoform X2 n=1 Tax=Crassostrea virginica TaxID=6565 RepID=A0A8B8BN12_CRAVI|nr:uncharacterized protein LOC111111846 isoform X2 [Crassostrea virginica]